MKNKQVFLTVANILIIILVTIGCEKSPTMDLSLLNRGGWYKVYDDYNSHANSITSWYFDTNEVDYPLLTSPGTILIVSYQTETHENLIVEAAYTAKNGNPSTITLYFEDCTIQYDILKLTHSDMQLLRSGKQTFEICTGTDYLNFKRIIAED